ncbi:hypothetical protein [Gloeocapsa sp. PCC 73106]|uniref:hypothetical protein n=1 Tax=Gloeocapsa sp. PCC 73106 TaxID=102232 RepID=UPI0002AD0A54|nr:hypothetical protein [Gloeocapsa sp. PCC 73106]ELR99662.1 hypothetical protein GLO73106DRAFT_00035140 [Gloeocapsa sp. PCC 73106]
MLETQNGSISLKELEYLLQERLCAPSVGVVPQKISCLLKDHHVMILLHYQQPAMPYPRKVFAVIEEMLNQLQIAQKYQILTYLVVQGKYQSKTRLTSIPVPLLPAKTHPKEQTPQKFPKLLLTSVGIISTIFLSYLANRYCLFNNCALIPQANQLANQAKLMIEETPKDLAPAYQNLTQSHQLLNQIPSWSPHYREAHSLALDYQQKAQNLDNFQKALTIKDQALSLTKLPLTIPDYAKIESLWAEAIALLEHIPSEDQLYPPAQLELAQINLEKQAITSLKTAQEASQLGKARESVARSLQNWQLVAATWRTALARLSQIPQHSQIAKQAEIKQLSTIYQSRLTQAQQRSEQEALALKLYQQGQQQAKLAQNLAASKQWQTSVYHWREALNILSKISPESHIFTEAKNSVKYSQNSLSEAEAKLTLLFNLEQICTADIRICDYDVSSEIIKVQLTPIYQQQLLQVSLATNAQTNLPAQMELRQHLSGLDNIFQSISNSSGIPLEVYDSQQILIVSYLPL